MEFKEVEDRTQKFNEMDQMQRTRNFKEMEQCKKTRSF